MEIGTFVAFLGLMGEVINPMISLSEVGKSVQTSIGSLVRVREVIEAEEVVELEDGSVPPTLNEALRFDRVGFSYFPGETTLDQITVEIAAGSRVAIVGRADQASRRC